jgi:hypothetical protein
MAVTPSRGGPGRGRQGGPGGRGCGQVVGLGGAGDAGGPSAADDDELTLDDGGAGAADRLRCGAQDVPTVSFRVIALHGVGVAAGGELAAANRLEVAGVGGDGEVVAGHRDVGGVAPAGAVADLDLGDQLLGVAHASAHDDDLITDHRGAAGGTRVKQGWAGGDAHPEPDHALG